MLRLLVTSLSLPWMLVTPGSFQDPGVLKYHFQLGDLNVKTEISQSKGLENETADKGWKERDRWTERGGKPEEEAWETWTERKDGNWKEREERERSWEDTWRKEGWSGEKELIKNKDWQKIALAKSWDDVKDIWSHSFEGKEKKSLFDDNAALSFKEEGNNKSNVNEDHKVNSTAKNLCQRFLPVSLGQFSEQVKMSVCLLRVCLLVGDRNQKGWRLLAKEYINQIKKTKKNLGFVFTIIWVFIYFLFCLGEPAYSA